MANANPGGVFGNNQIAIPQIDTRGPQYNNDLVAKNPIGGKIRWNNQVWRYVRHDQGSGTVVPVLGGPAWGKTITPAATATAVPVFKVTPDQTDSVFGRTPVGVYQCAVGSEPTHAYYTWIAIGGIVNCVVPGSVEEDSIVGSTTDGQFAAVAAGTAPTYTAVGLRMEGASSAGLSPVLLMNMDW